MNEAMERITTAGVKAQPADWDGYFNARQRVETAEEDLKKQQWMEESNDLRSPKEPYRRNQAGKGTGGKGYKGNAGRGTEPSRTPQAARSTQRSQPIVNVEVRYDDKVFPPQIRWKDEKDQAAVFTRHDKTSQLPKGLMLAASRELSDEEKVQLVDYVKYQHTISTRVDKELKTIQEGDVVFNHTGRSVYVKTQFDDAEQVQGFHAALADMMANGSTTRKDGTKKHEAFADKNAQFALYYNN